MPSDFLIDNGIIKIYYSFPDAIDTFMLYTDKDTVFNHKNITQLSEAEQQQYGLGITKSILQNTGTLVNLSNRVRDQNIAYLDMDGDGDIEKITLSPSASPDAVQYYREDDPLAYYQLQIGSAELEGFGDNVANILWGLSLDGQHILLVLYEDGPSADPYNFKKITSLKSVVLPAISAGVKFPPTASSQALSSKRLCRPIG